MRFVRNRLAERELERSPEMVRFLGEVADQAAREAESRLPYPRLMGGVSVDGARDGDGGVVVIKGPGWHLHEYGTKNHPPKPAIRPGVQAVISRYGGRWKES